MPPRKRPRSSHTLDERAMLQEKLALLTVQYDQMQERCTALATEMGHLQQAYDILRVKWGHLVAATEQQQRTAWAIVTGAEAYTSVKLHKLRQLFESGETDG